MARRIQRMVRSIRRTVVAIASLSVVALGLAMVESSLPTSVAGGDEHAGWGGESLAETHASPGLFSLIGVANACGLGASSCFKCHNGSRAAAPNMDETAAPWHAQHRTVNHSCAGCHDGNPRIIRKAMAHRNLIPDPNQMPDKSCASCHADDSNQYVQRYLTAARGEK